MSTTLGTIPHTKTTSKNTGGIATTVWAMDFRKSSMRKMKYHSLIHGSSQSLTQTRIIGFWESKASTFLHQMIASSKMYLSFGMLHLQKIPQHLLTLTISQETIKALVLTSSLTRTKRQTRTLHTSMVTMYRYHTQETTSMLSQSMRRISMMLKNITSTKWKMSFRPLQLNYSILILFTELRLLTKAI